MGDFTRVYDKQSGWEYVCSSAAIPEDVEILDTEAAPGPPVKRDPEDAPDGFVYPNGEPSLEWKIAELRDYARVRDVDIDGATTKKQVLKRIEDHQPEDAVVTPAEGAGTDPSLSPATEPTTEPGDAGENQEN